MAWAFNYLRQQQSSSFCKAVIKNRGVFCFCSTAVKIVLSMFIQQTVNWRCTHRADPVSIIDLKWKEGKDQTNIFFFSDLWKAAKTNEVEFIWDNWDAFVFLPLSAWLCFGWCSAGIQNNCSKALWKPGLSHVIAEPSRKRLFVCLQCVLFLSSW